MCRLLGLLSEGPAGAERWLVGSERSLLAQSHTTPKFAQTDGWGVAWRAPNGAVHLERGTGGAFEPGEQERFRSAASASDRASLVIGHLRHASNPMNLPRSRLIGIENSQPFVHGAWIFAHNGALPLPSETRPLLGELEPSVRGVNDSEVLFYLLLNRLGTAPSPPDAYARVVADLRKVWEEQGRTKPEPYSGLNVLLSPGPDELWAFCHWRGEHGSCFFDAKRPYYQMAFRADARQALFASEPFDAGPDWRTIPNGGFAHARRSHGLVVVEEGRLALPPGSLPAAGPSP